MEETKPRTSLAGLFLATTALCVVFACWVGWGRGINLFVMPLAVAFICGLLFPWGITAGAVTGATIVIVNAVFMEKDPSGLGPTEVVIPVHLVFFAIPVLLAAWGGKETRSWLSRPRGY